MAPPCARCGTFTPSTSIVTIRGTIDCSACAARPEVRLPITPGSPWKEAAAFLYGNR